MVVVLGLTHTCVDAASR